MITSLKHFIRFVESKQAWLEKVSVSLKLSHLEGGGRDEEGLVDISSINARTVWSIRTSAGALTVILLDASIETCGTESRRR